MYTQDQRIVVTLDAGGTHFRFTALKACKPIVDTIEFPSENDNLDKCLHNIVLGFEQIINQLPEKPVAISFAFPGPADYPNGIFPEALSNFPCFKGGVALGPMLERKFNLPIFINNDADLFAYGEALAGILPEVNGKLKEAGSVKQYHNLVGFILGTGFGIGITTNNNMYIGDNCCSEIYCAYNKQNPEIIVEDSVAARSILYNYNQLANDPQKTTYTDSKTIYDIADGVIPGDQEAARKAFFLSGEAAGFTIAHAACMLDGILVLGGGLANSHKYYLPGLLKELRREVSNRKGEHLTAVPSYVYNLEDEAEYKAFLQSEQKEITIYGTQEKVYCDAKRRLGVAVSHMGTSKAATIGAYCYALHKLDEKQSIL